MLRKHTTADHKAATALGQPDLFTPHHLPTPSYTQVLAELTDIVTQAETLAGKPYELIRRNMGNTFTDGVSAAIRLQISRWRAVQSGLPAGVMDNHLEGVEPLRARLFDVITPHLAPVPQGPPPHRQPPADRHSTFQPLGRAAKFSLNRLDKPAATR